MSYLIEKFKGQYRLSCPIDKSTNDFPRKLNGTYEDADIYIDCLQGNRIYYYGKGFLEAYIPSIGRGRNIIRQIYAKLINPYNVNIETTDRKIFYSIIDKELYESEISKSELITNIVETDSEISFYFPFKHSESIIPFLKPKTVGANRSPFSAKNLPKEKYDIPESEMREYRDITNPLVLNNQSLMLSKMTQNYINIMSKNKTYKSIDMKALMKKKMLKGKEFIHSEGYWDNYLKFLKGEIVKCTN